LVLSDLNKDRICGGVVNEAIGAIGEGEFSWGDVGAVDVVLILNSWQA